MNEIFFKQVFSTCSPVMQLEGYPSMCLKNKVTLFANF